MCHKKTFFPVIYILLFVIILSGYSFGQWVNNPSINTLLISSVSNPVNITSVEDLKGGAFIFWEENRTGFNNEIFFLHLDGDGKVTFRVDGKKVSDKADAQINPAASTSLPNTAVVVWKSAAGTDKGNLFAQRVTDKGRILWTSTGIKLTASVDDIVHYAVDADNNGNTFIVYTEKKDFNYSLHLLKVDPSGNLLYTGDKPVITSEKSKSLASVVADNEGGAYVVWLETVNNKSTIMAQHIDADGKISWGKTPAVLSGSPSNVTSFSVKRSGKASIYIAWQVHKNEKTIYHQLINRTGKLLWQQGGKPATELKGSQMNPQVLPSDSLIILSWTHESSNDRDIYIQKYNMTGNPLWGKNGIPVIRLDQDQFGQKIVTDGKGGAIVSWIDRRDESRYEHLYAQRVNKSGELVWDTLAIPVASHSGSEKSYLSVISDGKGGIIAVFKDRRENITGIYGQKVFNTGTYISQIVGFQAVIEGDSVKISWYAANETGRTTYEIERTASTDTANSTWEVVNYVLSEAESNASMFEIMDKPVEAGTIYYRLIQTDEKGNIQLSDISRVNYFFGASDFSIAQNSPNPFSESTTIKFYLPREMNVSMEFFDSHIEKIREIKQKFPAGENEIKFNAEGLKQGVYFYRFEAGDYVDVKKMVVVK